MKNLILILVFAVTSLMTHSQKESIDLQLISGTVITDLTIETKNDNDEFGYLVGFQSSDPSINYDATGFDTLEIYTEVESLDSLKLNLLSTNSNFDSINEIIIKSVPIIGNTMYFNEYSANNNTIVESIVASVDTEIDTNIINIYDFITFDTTNYFIFMLSTNSTNSSATTKKIFFMLKFTDTTGSGSVSVIEEVNDVTNTRVYPNPVIDNLTVEFETTNSSTELGIYSTSGQLMYKDNEYRNFGGNKVSVNMTDYPKGVYLVRLGTEVKKVVK